jgi:hypothetical protein
VRLLGIILWVVLTASTLVSSTGRSDVELVHSVDRFQRPGFYQVVGLRVPDAGFLFEPV